MILNKIIVSLALVGALAYICLSFLSYKNHHFLKTIIIIIFLGLILRLYVSSDFYLHEWDERYHALVAKNLINHPLVPTLYDKPILSYDYTDWTQNHIWLHKQPLALWLIALSMKIFGTNEIALRLPSIILSTLAVLLTYYIGCFIFNREVGLLASFFQATNLFMINLASGRWPTDHIDTVYQFFIELGIFLSVIYTKNENNKIIPLIGITAGLAILTKWLPGLIIFPVFVILLVKQHPWRWVIKKLMVVSIICISVFLPWQIYINYYFPKEASFESIYNFRHIFESLEGHSGTIFYHLLYMPYFFSPLIYLGLTWFLLKVYRQKDLNLLAMAVWLLIPYIFFSLVATKMGAYIIISAPIIFMAQALFWCDLKENNLEIKLINFKKILLILILILPTLQTSWALFKTVGENRNPKWVVELKKLNDKIGDKNCVVFNDNRFIETMFYSSCTAYPFIPSNLQIYQLTEKGYKVFIFDKGTIPSSIRQNANVILLQYVKIEPTRLKRNIRAWLISCMNYEGFEKYKPDLFRRLIDSWEYKEKQ